MLSDFRTTILGIVTLIDFLFAILVLLKGRRRQESITFGFFILTLTAWTFGLLMFYLASDVALSLFWAKVLYFTGNSTAVFFLFFALNFPQKKAVLNWWKTFLIFMPLVILFGLYFFSNSIISGTLSEKTFLYGPLRLAFDVPFCFYFLLAFGKLFKNYKKHAGLERLQLKYVVFSAFPALIISAFTNVILLWFGIFDYIWIGPEVSLILIASSIYAILRYRLMDIRIVIRKSTAYLLIAGFVYGFFYFSVWLLNTLFGSIYERGAMIFGTFVAVLFVFLFFLLDRFIKLIANKYFFGGLYSQHEALRTLTKKPTTIIDLNKLIDLVVSTTKNTMGLDKAGVLLKDEKTGQFKIVRVIGFQEENGISLVKDNFLTQHLETTKKPLVYEELKLMIRDTRDEKTKAGLINLRNKLKRIKAALCLPLIVKDNLEGILVLGRKLSQDAYSKEDLKLLEILANQTSIAIENSRLYDKVKDLSENLQAKVNEQTKDIKKKAQNIQALLNMKTELLDTISHQLRTPVSIFRGMLSMIDEKSGEIEKHEREDLINKSLAAADRLGEFRDTCKKSPHLPQV